MTGELPEVRRQSRVEKTDKCADFSVSHVNYF